MSEKPKCREVGCDPVTCKHPGCARPRFSTDPKLNAALEEDARKLEAMGGDPGITLVAPPLPAGLDAATDSSGVGSELVVGLDFAGAYVRASTGSRIERTSVEENYRADLNAQCAALIAQAREEERREPSQVRTLSKSLAAYGEPVPSDPTVFTLAVCLDQFASRTERALATLRASHAEVVKAIREWQEARKAKREYNFPICYDFGADPVGSAVIQREKDAEAALATLDLGRNG